MGFYFERKRVLGFKKKSHDFYTKASLKDFTCSKDHFFFFFLMKEIPS